MQFAKYISSKQIINRLYSRTGLKEAIDFSDCIEWIYDTLSMLGAPVLYIPKITGWKQDENLDFDQYVFPLPCDFHVLQAIAINGYPARPATSDFQYLLDGNCCEFDTLPDAAFDIFTDSFGNTFNSSLGNKAGGEGGSYTFYISNGVVTTNVKQGRACIAYKAFPIDDEGFPLIPDEERIKEAVFSTLRRNIDYIKWREDPESRAKRELFEYSEREYCFFMGSATSRINTPEVGEMENIKNNLLVLKPRIQEYNNFFTTLGANGGLRG